jgi:hypothetical protein
VVVDFEDDAIQRAREDFEDSWNVANRLRTYAAILVVVILLLVIFLL